MNQVLLLFLMFCGGIAIAVQPSINGRLAQKVGTLESSCISFAVGTLLLLAVVLVAGKGSFRGIANTSWWELTGGGLGAFFVTMTIIAIPRIGTTAALAAVIGAQRTPPGAASAVHNRHVLRCPCARQPIPGPAS